MAFWQHETLLTHDAVMQQLQVILVLTNQDRVKEVVMGNSYDSKNI